MERGREREIEADRRGRKREMTKRDGDRGKWSY